MNRSDFEKCVVACEECARACDSCISACLREADVGAMARCIALDIDCGAACRLAAGMMTRESPLARQACRFCALVCKACEEECATHRAAHCQDCARICHECADLCATMAA